MSDAQDLKALNTVIKNLLRDIATLKAQHGDPQKLKIKEMELASARAKLTRFQESKKKTLICSEHAVLRYPERVKGIDIAKTLLEICGGHEPGSLPAVDGDWVLPTHIIIVRHGIVVTVTTKGGQPS